jgi:hypothetical protein
MNAESVNRPSWSHLLEQSVTQPGAILEAYSRFYGYSLGNRIAALFQCVGRGIQPGPIATFPRWIELGRHVKRGEKAIVLCQPVTVKDRDAEQNSDTPCRTVFIWRPRWFVLAQTDGAEFVAPSLPQWDKTRALATLEISEITFAEMDGNVQGYARGRSVAINPVAELPTKTLFHELGHVVLGHTVKSEANDFATLPKNLREVEAESVALLCLESLSMPGAQFCRGYIQHWLGSGQTIPETSAQRIFHAADAILRAGNEQV